MIQHTVSVPAVGVFAGMDFFENVAVVEIVNASRGFSKGCCHN